MGKIRDAYDDWWHIINDLWKKGANIATKAKIMSLLKKFLLFCFIFLSVEVIVLALFIRFSGNDVWHNFISPRVPKLVAKAATTKLDQGKSGRPVAALDAFPKPEYLVLMYSGPCKNSSGNNDRPYTHSIWRAKIKGDEKLTGTVADTGEKGTSSIGRIVGFDRGNVIVFSYMSSRTSHHGYGSFFLARRNSGAEGSPSKWAGFAVFHDCFSMNGMVCSTPDTIAIVPAMMSSELGNIYTKGRGHYPYYDGFKKAVLASHLGYTREEAQKISQADGGSTEVGLSSCLQTKFQQ